MLISVLMPIFHAYYLRNTTIVVGEMPRVCDFPHLNFAVPLPT